MEKFFGELDFSQAKTFLLHLCSVKVVQRSCKFTKFYHFSDYLKDKNFGQITIKTNLSVDAIYVRLIAFPTLQELLKLVICNANIITIFRLLTGCGDVKINWQQFRYPHKQKKHVQKYLRTQQAVLLLQPTSVGHIAGEMGRRACEWAECNFQHYTFYIKENQTLTAV